MAAEPNSTPVSRRTKIGEAGLAGAKPQSATVISAMHARYEQTNAEFDQIDTVLTKLHVERDRASLKAIELARALNDNMVETDALRRAILLQVPDSRKDALILQYHIWVEQDMQATDVDRPNASARDALSTAIDTLFDFMACETHEAHAEIGEQFTRGCTLVRDKRRYRTGLVEA